MNVLTSEKNSGYEWEIQPLSCQKLAEKNDEQPQGRRGATREYEISRDTSFFTQDIGSGSIITWNARTPKEKIFILNMRMLGLKTALKEKLSIPSQDELYEHGEKFMGFEGKQADLMKMPFPPDQKTLLENIEKNMEMNIKKAENIIAMIESGKVNKEALNSLDNFLESARISQFSLLNLIAPEADKGKNHPMGGTYSGDEYLNVLADMVRKNLIQVDMAIEYFEWKVNIGSADMKMLMLSSSEKLAEQYKKGSISKIRKALKRPDEKSLRNDLEKRFGRNFVKRFDNEIKFAYEMDTIKTGNASISEYFKHLPKIVNEKYPSLFKNNATRLELEILSEMAPEERAYTLIKKTIMSTGEGIEKKIDISPEKLSAIFKGYGPETFKYEIEKKFGKPFAESYSNEILLAFALETKEFIDAIKANDRQKTKALMEDLYGFDFSQAFDFEEIEKIERIGAPEKRACYLIEKNAGKKGNKIETMAMRLLPKIKRTADDYGLSPFYGRAQIRGYDEKMLYAAFKKEFGEKAAKKYKNEISIVFLMDKLHFKAANEEWSGAELYKVAEQAIGREFVELLPREEMMDELKSLYSMNHHERLSRLIRLSELSQELKEAGNSTKRWRQEKLVEIAREKFGEEFASEFSNDVDFLFALEKGKMKNALEIMNYRELHNLAEKYYGEKFAQRHTEEEFEELVRKDTPEEMLYYMNSHSFGAIFFKKPLEKLEKLKIEKKNMIKSAANYFMLDFVAEKNSAPLFPEKKQEIPPLSGQWYKDHLLRLHTAYNEFNSETLKIDWGVSEKLRVQLNKYERFTIPVTLPAGYSYGNIESGVKPVELEIKIPVNWVDSYERNRKIVFNASMAFSGIMASLLTKNPPGAVSSTALFAEIVYLGITGYYAYQALNEFENGSKTMGGIYLASLLLNSSGILKTIGAMGETGAHARRIYNIFMAGGIAGAFLFDPSIETYKHYKTYGLTGEEAVQLSRVLFFTIATMGGLQPRGRLPPAPQ